MLSRRNIRIKVMQMLYANSRDAELTFEEILKRYRESIHHSFELYLYNLKFLLKVTHYAFKDAEKRNSKHLPTEEDKLFTPILYTNQLTQAIAKNNQFNQLVNDYSLEKNIDNDTVRSVYLEFSKKDEYKAYLKGETTQEDHKNILLGLFKTCMSSELYSETVEDQYPLWKDDKSLIVGTLKKTIKGLASGIDFCELYKPTEETTIEFGEKLLTDVYKSDKSLLEIIEPSLKNWDADRVAIIDMILLKMALSELMIFPTIPTKVTLNEFVEISKMYSTEKSKDFINGILDRLMKKLNKEGKIKKEGRGLME